MMKLKTKTKYQKPQPTVLVLTGFGINSDRELAECFSRAGGRVSLVHVNDLAENPKLLGMSQIFAIPGGFSFGDHLGSGRVLGNKLKIRLGDEIRKFIQQDRLVLGICNGFQVLVKMGLLPNLGGEIHQEMTLTNNDSGKFEDRWVRLTVNPRSPNVWMKGVDSLSLPIRHGEGKLVSPSAEFSVKIQKLNLEALYYADENGRATERYPDNPNGSEGGVAGLCDESGKVFGLMPHPEAFMEKTLQPSWKHESLSLTGPAMDKLRPIDGAGMAIFYNSVDYFS